MMKMQLILSVLITSTLLAGCVELEKCEGGYRIKSGPAKIEYKTIFFDQTWYDSPDDKLLDGAIRIRTWTNKDARTLYLRCFKPSQGSKGALDMRYSISVPLLSKFVSEINKSGDVNLVVSVDGLAIGSYKARVVSHDFGISFLADIDIATLEKIAAAKKKIIVMPRQKNQSLDEIIEFGVAKLSEHLKPVFEACKTQDPAKPEKT